MNGRWSLRRFNWKILLPITLLAAIYFALAYAALSLVALPDAGTASRFEFVTPVWPSAGVSLAVILLFGKKLWPGIWLGSLGLHLSIYGLTGDNLLAAIAIGCSNSLQILVAAALLERFSGGRHLLARSQTVFKFIGLTALVTIAFAAFAVLSLGWSGAIAWSTYGENWWTWWSSNMFGILIFTPALLAWSNWLQVWQRPRSQIIEFGIWLGLASVIGSAAFWLGYPLEYMLIPIIVWSVFSFRQAGTMVLVVAIAAIAVGATVNDFGPFARSSLRDSLLLLQAFIGVVALTALILSAVILEREQAEAELVAANRDLSLMAAQLQQSNQALEQINDELEQRVERRTAALQREQEKAERLLLNVLPQSIAEQLKQAQDAIAQASTATYPFAPLPTAALVAEQFSEVTILFADIVDFTSFAAQVSPVELLAVLSRIFSVFDQLAEQYGLEKIKTIGDEYMIVGGVPTAMPNHAEAIAEMALAMQTEISRFSRGSEDDPFRLRIGISTGSVVAGVLGMKKFSYDLWGDTVNIASRMQTQGEPGRIQVAASTYEHLQDRYCFEDRGAIAIKGKGTMHTYWLIRKQSS